MPLPQDPCLASPVVPLLTPLIQFIAAHHECSAVLASKSRVPMDHYSYPIGDNQAASQELGRPGKRVNGPELHGGCMGRMGYMGRKWLGGKGVPCSQSSLFMASDPATPLWQGINNWLSSLVASLSLKCKHLQPSIALVRAGRKDLYDVVQHTCGQRPEFTGGDHWCTLCLDSPLLAISLSFAGTVQCLL